MKIVLARVFILTHALRERHLMSKGSREAMESTAGAALRMARAERTVPAPRGAGRPGKERNGE